MDTPLWLTAIVAVVSPLVVLWSVHRTDRRERLSRDHQISREYREARCNAYLNYLNSLSVMQLMSANTALKWPEWHTEQVNRILSAENAVRIYATPNFREFAEGTTSFVVATLIGLQNGTIDPEHEEEAHERFKKLQDVMAIVVRDDLAIASVLDGEILHKRDPRKLFRKVAIESATSRDINVLARKVGIIRLTDGV